MADATLNATLRTEFGKGASRRLRRDGRVPAVIYGHGTDPVHLALPGHQTALALRVSNALLEIVTDGDTQLALVKQVQRDAIRGTVEHVDLLIVRRGEKVIVEVPVTVVGDAAPEIEYPVLSELPPLPAEGGDESPADETDPSDSTFSGIQTAAFVLAGVVLVAGAAGLTLVTRRGRGEDPHAADERPDPHGAGPHPDGPSR